MILLYILLAVIAYILWRIYRQKEDEKDVIYNEKLDAENEQARKEKFKDYPHHAENNLPELPLAWMLYILEAVKIDFSEGKQKWHTLWNLTEEILEDLEKHHEGTTTEHLIAVRTYWQIAVEAMEGLIKQSPEKTKRLEGLDSAPIEGKKMDVKPFTDIKNILSLFPKKANHPDKELLFSDEKGNFPRESKGSKLINDRIYTTPWKLPY